MLVNVSIRPHVSTMHEEVRQLRKSSRYGEPIRRAKLVEAQYIGRQL